MRDAAGLERASEACQVDVRRQKGEEGVERMGARGGMISSSVDVARFEANDSG